MANFTISIINAEQFTDSRGIEGRGIESPAALAPHSHDCAFCNKIVGCDGDCDATRAYVAQCSCLSDVAPPGKEFRKSSLHGVRPKKNAPP